MSKLVIGKSIRDAIQRAPMSDNDLGDLIGVAENTVRRWKLGSVKHIRKLNLNALAEVLKKEITYNDSTVELEERITTSDVVSINENNINIGSDNVDINAKDLLGQKDDYIELLKENITSLKSDVVYLRNKTDQLDRLVTRMESRKIDLDHSRMQFVVDMEKQTFVNCTQPYADIYGRDAFDMIRNISWLDVIDEVDVWRFPIIQAIETSEQTEENNGTWKVQGKKVKYVETITLPLDEEGRFKRVEAKISTKAEWEISNNFYRQIELKYLPKVLSDASA